MLVRKPKRLGRYFNTRKINSYKSSSIIHPTNELTLENTHILIDNKIPSSKLVAIANKYDSSYLPENTERGIPIVEATVISPPTICERIRKLFKTTSINKPIQPIPRKYTSKKRRKSSKNKF
jgi:hypothetical protein